MLYCANGEDIMGAYFDAEQNGGQIIELAKLYAPYSSNTPLIRLGGDCDGGYLVPDDFIGIKSCLSPGVSWYAGFEESLFRNYGIKSHLIDYSVDQAPDGFIPESFTKKFLGAWNDEIYTTMESWISCIGEVKEKDDLLLQMDIEGSEYVSIIATPMSILRRFRIIVLEVHLVHKWIDPVFYHIAKAMAMKLISNHTCVHLHVNNYAPIVELGGVMLPDVFEVTFYRKDRCKPSGPAVLPNPLDRPCNPDAPEVQVPNAMRHD